MLSDYSSESLDLGDPHSFRPLWKPVGALDEKRLAAARASRQKLQLDAEGAEVEPLYHTHYSSPAYVAYYLVRVFPELTIHNQSGRFDQSSHTFASVEETWQNVSRRATGDVKELIPQFYSEPSFLTNELGIAPSQDVVLPPWAHGSSKEFVRIMRAALESDYVSAHLHLWIDLVFGSKQVGPAALAADNLFHRYTYEGALLGGDTDDDAAELIRSFALEFGQTPPQLFTRSHPPRRLHIHRSVPWRAAEPAATLIEASARRWLTRHHIEENAIAFFFDEVVFRSTAFPSLEVPPIDLLRRSTNGLQLAYSRRTAEWMLALTSAVTDLEPEIRSFLESCFRSDDHHAHHPSERHPFAQLLAEYCSLAMRLFDQERRRSASQMNATMRLTALSAAVQLGVKRTHTVIVKVLPPLRKQSRSKVVRALVLDEITSRLFRSPIMPLIRDVHGADDAVYAERVAAFSSLRPHHFGGIANLPQCFWLSSVRRTGRMLRRSRSGSLASTSDAPYAAAIRELTHLSATYSTQRKLGLLMHMLEAIQQQVWSHHGVTSIEEQAHDDRLRLRLAADNLVSIVTYVISQSTPSLHLCSELAFIERFADEGSLLGEQGGCLATFQAALGCLRSLSWSEIEAAAQRIAEVSTSRHSAPQDVGAATPTPVVPPAPLQTGDEQRPYSTHGSGLEAVNASASPQTSGPCRQSQVGERLARARLAKSVGSPSDRKASPSHDQGHSGEVGEEVQTVKLMAEQDSFDGPHLEAGTPHHPGSKSRLSKRLARTRIGIGGGPPATIPTQPNARQAAILRRDEPEEEAGGVLVVEPEDAADEEMLEVQRVTKQASLDMVRAHLAEFKQANGPEATFKGWITMLHQENATLDHRLEWPENDWLALWNEAQAAHEPTCGAVAAVGGDTGLDVDAGGDTDSRESYV